MAALLFPALDSLLPDTTIDQSQDHGDRLIEWVGEGSLEVAFVAIADQLRLPDTTTATAVARDSFVLLSAQNADPPGNGRRRLEGSHVLTHTFDFSIGILHDKLADMGATSQLAATAETAVRIARGRGTSAVLTRSQALSYALPPEKIVPLRIGHQPTLFMVTRPPVTGPLERVVKRLAARLGMAPCPQLEKQ